MVICYDLDKIKEISANCVDIGTQVSFKGDMVDTLTLNNFGSVCSNIATAAELTEKFAVISKKFMQSTGSFIKNMANKVEETEGNISAGYRV